MGTDKYDQQQRLFFLQVASPIFSFGTRNWEKQDRFTALSPHSREGRKKMKFMWIIIGHEFSQ